MNRFIFKRIGPYVLWHPALLAGDVIIKFDDMRKGRNPDLLCAFVMQLQYSEKKRQGVF